MHMYNKQDSNTKLVFKFKSAFNYDHSQPYCIYKNKHKYIDIYYYKNIIFIVTMPKV